MKKGLKKYFIPHDENNHQPHSLKDKTLRNILLTSIVIEVIALVLILPVFNGKLDFLSAVLPSVLVSETNETRLDQNLGTLEVNDLLIAAAQMKADDMAEKGYFSHVSPDGKQPWYFLTQAGYQYEVAGENLAVNFVDSQQVHRAWMNSPTHKANIVKDNYTEIGIATAKGVYKGRDTIFVVQFFGKPKSEAQVSTPVVAGINDQSTSLVEQNGEQNTEQESEPEERVEEEIEEQEIAGTSTTSAPIISSAIISSAELKTNSFNTNNAKQDLSSRRILSSPLTTIGFILAILFILVSVSLLLKIFIKIKIQYPKMILNSTLAIVVLASFYFLNSTLVELFGEIL